MKDFAKKTSNMFAAGAFAGLCKYFIVWFCVSFGVLDRLGVDASGFSYNFYSLIVWSGAWCLLLFIIPVLENSFFWRGVLLSFIPAFVELFILLPKAKHGMLGTKLGPLAPLVVIVISVIWGGIAGLWLKVIK